MQVKIDGAWLYMYTGRDMIAKESVNDPFTHVHAIRLKDITGLRVDTQEHTLTLFAKGHPYPIQYQTGYSLNEEINNLYPIARKIADAIGISTDHLFDTFGRTKETDEACPRYVGMEEELDMYQAEKELQPHEKKEYEELMEKAEKAFTQYKETIRTIKYITGCYKKLHGLESECKVYESAEGSGK